MEITNIALEGGLQRAFKAGRWMVSITYKEGDNLLHQLITERFPFEDFKKSHQEIYRLLELEIKKKSEQDQVKP